MWETWLRSSSISLDRYGSNTRKVSKSRPVVSNETLLATGQEFFFTKVARVQSITDIFLLDFWLILLSWMFISSYTPIYFFVKKFIFLNVYISVYAMYMRYAFICFLVEKGPPIKYVRSWWGNGGRQKGCLEFLLIKCF